MMLHVWIERSDGRAMTLADYFVLASSLLMIMVLAGVGTYVVIRYLRIRRETNLT